MRILSFSLSFILVMVSTVLAEQVEVEFSYSSAFESVNFYMDDTIYCSDVIENISTVDGGYVLRCVSGDMSPGWHSYTLTAIVDGEETMHSSSYRWMKLKPGIGVPGIKTLQFTNGATVIVIPQQ